MQEQQQPSYGPMIDVQEIMRQVRRKLREENRERDDLVRLARKSMPANLLSAIARLKVATSTIRYNAAAIGEIPPGPATFRARIGATFVGVLRRALFWLIPPIRTGQEQLADALAEHVRATEEIIRVMQQVNVELESLRRAVQARETPQTERSEAAVIKGGAR